MISHNARLKFRRRQKWRTWRSYAVLAILFQLVLIPSVFADEIDVLSYNIYMRPFFHDGQAIRARYLINQLPSYDAIVFQEAFDDRIRNLLLAGLRTDYPFSTRILGKDAGLGQDGGVVILSKWPIIRQSQRVFTAGERSINRCPGQDCCAGSDCYADKGVVYALINKSGRCYHLFGTHMQSGSETWRLRNAQFKIIRDFIKSRHISSEAPVIIAGDMNVDRLDKARFADMRGLLKAQQPPRSPTAPSIPTASLIKGSIYTFDGRRNDINDNEDVQRYVDYVLYSVDHLKPGNAFNQVRIIRAPEPWRQYFWHNWRRDLSDHYPVLGHFAYARDTEQSRACP